MVNYQKYFRYPKLVWNVIHVIQKKNNHRLHNSHLIGDLRLRHGPAVFSFYFQSNIWWSWCTVKFFTAKITRRFTVKSNRAALVFVVFIIALFGYFFNTWFGKLKVKLNFDFFKTIFRSYGSFNVILKGYTVMLNYLVIVSSWGYVKLRKNLVLWKKAIRVATYELYYCFCIIIVLLLS